jgi:hypothetical protein
VSRLRLAHDTAKPEIGPEKAFGQALREIRTGKEISQERLGLDAGFDRTYISLIEPGDQQPDDSDGGAEGGAVEDY